MAANARKATTWVGKIVLGGQGRKILYSGVDLGDIGDIGDIGGPAEGSVVGRGAQRYRESFYRRMTRDALGGGGRPR